MRLVRTQRHARRGAAAVEMAIVTPFLLVVIIGVWELGRLIQVQQILNNAARDGARLAAQGQVINLIGAYTDIYTSSGTPNVQSTVTEYLQAAGITNLTGMTVQFQYLTGNTALTDPYQASTNQQFQVTVTLPYNNVRWTSLSLVNPTTLTGQCVWQSMVDNPFTIDTTLPTWNPNN